MFNLALGLTEAKQRISAAQAAIVPAGVTIAGEHACTCAACGRQMASRQRYGATFRLARQRGRDVHTAFPLRDAAFAEAIDINWNGLND